jgi:hypothetical protein
MEGVLLFDVKVEKLGGATFILSTLIGPFVCSKIRPMGFFISLNKRLIYSFI